MQGEGENIVKEEMLRREKEKGVEEGKEGEERKGEGEGKEKRMGKNFLERRKRKKKEKEKTSLKIGRNLEGGREGRRISGKKRKEDEETERER